MCGRFNVSNTPGLQALLAGLGSDLQSPPPRFNVAPTEDISLLRYRGDGLELVDSRWWLTPSWARELSQKYSMFNARSEGLTKSPAFRKPFASQRGIVPMSSFIEWRGTAGSKQPWLISNPDQAMAVAALWDVWFGTDDGEPLLSCTLVTTAAAESFKPWHGRMPVVLVGDEQQRWLDNDQAIAGDDSIFRPALKTPLRLVPVDRATGNARNKDPELMAGIGDTVELAADRD